LIRDEADASSEDLDRIVQCIATAPFNPHPIRVRTRDRGLTYGRIVLGRSADSLDFHLAKRVQQEEQWIDGTTADEYRADLTAAVLHSGARLLVNERAGDVFSATISPTEEIVPVERRGENWLMNLLVVYSATHANLRTGYMFSSLATLNLPEAIRWLR
jgi:hypothetical protein